MQSPIPEYLERVLEEARQDDTGEPIAFLQTLTDPSKLAVALTMVDGEVYSAGDDDVEFSIQSISKAFVYAIAIEDAGLAEVLRRIGVEPSGEAFNELSLPPGSNKPMNPMINAGAITAHSLLVGPNATVEQRVERILDVFSRLASRPLRVDEDVYQAELTYTHRNMGLAYMLKAAGTIACDPEVAVLGYIRQCSILVTVRDLAMMAAVLCNADMHPVSREQIIPQASVCQVLSVMTTCGMYDAAGDRVSNVGVPAKSGVSGGILGALPGQVGIAVFSPKLDARGNSVRGIAICERLSRDGGLRMMDSSQTVHTSVNTTTSTVVPKKGEPYEPKSQIDVVIFSLRGAVKFAGSEQLTRALTRELGDPNKGSSNGRHHADDAPIVLSFSNVY